MSFQIKIAAILTGLVSLVASCGVERNINRHSELEGFAADSSAENVALLFQGNIPEADNDMNRLEKILADPAGGYNFKAEKHSSVTSRQILDVVRQRVPAVGPNGTLFLFLAGHGSPNGWLQTNDNSMINFRKIEAAIREVRPQKLKRLVVIIFSCYGGQWINQTMTASLTAADGDGTTFFNDQSYSEFTAKTAAEDFTSGLRADPIYEQLFIMTAANDRELSYFNGNGSMFIQTLARVFSSIKNEMPSKATMRDLYKRTAAGVSSSHISYRAVPDELVMSEPVLGPTTNTQPTPNLSGDIFVNLGATDAQGTTPLLLAAAAGTQRLLVCAKDIQTCKATPTSDVNLEAAVVQGSGRAFFSARGFNPLTFVGRSLHLMAVDATGRVTALRSVQIKAIQQ